MPKGVKGFPRVIGMQISLIEVFAVMVAVLFLVCVVISAFGM